MYKWIPNVAIWNFLIFLMLSLMNNVQAECEIDKDWPQKPCYADPPPPTLAKQLSQWNHYYEFKGKEWMEMKKTEIDNAIKANNLAEWIKQGDLSTDFEENNPNRNVWNYYYLNGMAPHYVIEDIKYPPPKQQMKESGFLSSNIRCNVGLELVFKSTNGAPACIKPSSFSRLVEIGWTLTKL